MTQVVRLWVHECERVLRDRLITDADVLKFEEFKELTVRKHFADVPLVRLVCCLFGHGHAYRAVPDVCRINACKPT